MSADARELVRVLRSRPGRGGVRLSYQQAELALRLIEAGARAVARERGRVGREPGELEAPSYRRLELELADDGATRLVDQAIAAATPEVRDVMLDALAAGAGVDRHR